jgi:hypothetical protein
MAGMFWAARYGKIVDPFGHEWGINQQVKDQSHEETQIAANEFFAKQKQSHLPKSARHRTVVDRGRDSRCWLPPAQTRTGAD